MHSGGMLFLLAAPKQTLGSLVFTLFGCAYMLIGTLIEERRLAAQLGEAWERYAARVPMLLPNLQKQQK
jgi:protein-S-isoprenylcysteine O-methyltransferase Ste14